MPNRLATESSPYLRQHADNPVDWWPWTAEAFAEAKRRDVPVFVSIGYAACHWCHVMAHESFEDAATAKLMNEQFVNIKVDREERPDVDAIYMNAIQVQGEGGGWPLSAFCLPDGRPYFLGTYFPLVPKFGRPTFQDLLRAMADAFKNRRADAEDNALALVDGLQRVDAHYRRGAQGADPKGLTASLLITAGRQLAERCDPEHGGLGGAPKFPSSSTHDLLARTSRFSFGEPAREAFDKWARGMAEGGIYDHLGGGFARYSVDAKWLVPHFEKMLYDNAQLLGIYASVCAMGGPFATRAGEVIAETIGFFERELSDAGGGLWSSLDADSEGEEGKFYVWTPAQLREVLGPTNALVFAQAYGVTEAGNFEHRTSVVSRITPRTSPFEEEQLAELRAKLLAARGTRIRPGTDDKVLAGWNGLAISGLVAAWRAIGHPPALALALRVASFLRDRMISGDRIARVYHEGQTKLDGTLDDYAFCALAFLELAEATGDRAWWDLGTRLLGAVRERFVAEEDGIVVFYLAPAGDPLLIHRPESHHDGAIPSGAALAVTGLVRLGLVAGDDAALSLAEKYLVQRLTGTVAVNAWATSALLAALDLYLHEKTLVVSDGPNRDALIAAARQSYAPTLMLAGPWAAPSILEGKVPAPDGAARAYVCSGQTCSAPVTTTSALLPLFK
ncbi:MAG: thioredoxin domain-containing protein [Deltaproteobacteria bacterium]|nr:thioredoxin domain-containing protein [Deltaproteobacteria bacterium]MDQ3298250.1 thioredoxin domain-containing protein [Myxococcota bacterium]